MDGGGCGCGWNGWMGVEWGGSFGRGSFDVTALSSSVDSADSAAETSLIGHGSETAEPQQDSRPRGGQLVCGPGAVSAPSNQLKAKRDGWMDGWMDGGGMGWKLWPWP